MSFLILLIALGLFSRGVLLSLTAKTSMHGKLKVFSITKTNNALEYTEENMYASKAYLFIGVIVFLFTVILLLTFHNIVNKYALLYIISIFIIDVFINQLVKIKIKINKYDNSQIVNRTNKEDE